MKNDNFKRYLLPNSPYLFILWACLKVGTAYRLAAGVAIPQKLVGMMQTVGPAFSELARAYHDFDWLIGIIGTAAIRLFVYVKAKNAKKYRRDVEYGSARWSA